MTIRLTDAELRERYTQIANDLAAWINHTPLPPSEIHPVYAAHVLLCDLIEQRFAVTPAGSPEPER